jgi:hypothetical protein
MTIYQAEMQRLSLLIQRILDAEVLCDTQGMALLTESEAARLSLEAGDKETAHRHIERIALFTETLVKTETLALMEGQAVIQVTNRILNPQADADA